MQLVFQDPYASLNPRMRVRAIVGEGIEIHRLARGKEKEDRIAELLEMVGMGADAIDALSARIFRRTAPAYRDRAGARGQAALPGARRAGLGARRFDPGADHQPAAGPAGAAEADLSLHRARPAGGRAHQQSRRDHVPRQDRRDCQPRRDLRESAPSVHARAALGDSDDHVAAAKAERIKLPGEVPSPLNPPTGCSFHPRCPYAKDICRTYEPPLETGPRWPCGRLSRFSCA